MQAYSDPKRENDPYSLPNVEIWESFKAWTICEHCGPTELPYEMVYVTDKTHCPQCMQECDRAYNDNVSQFWYWHCFPGCLPDSDPVGPFETYAQALAAAREDSNEDSEEEE